MIEALSSSLNILVVLYNTPMAKSVTLISLLPQLEGRVVKLTIWDNSPESMADYEFISHFKQFVPDTVYYHSPENTSLSVVYNRVVRGSVADVHLILDQDSCLPSNFIKTLMAAVQSHPDVKLFVPRVRVEGELVSPGYFGTFKGRRASTFASGINPTASSMIVSSGMAIRSQLHDVGLCFNEELWLYAIDTDFFLRFRERYREFYVLECDILHHSALRSDLEVEQALFRFRNLRWSYLKMFRSQGKSVFVLRLYLFYLSFRYSIRYVSFKFFLRWDSDGRN